MNLDFYTPEEREAVIIRMHDRMWEWRKSNPDVTAMVQFFAANKVIIVAGIYQALAVGLVKVNSLGYDMLKTMCEPEPDEPTIEMVKAAIYLTTKPKGKQ